MRVGRRRETQGRGLCARCECPEDMQVLVVCGSGIFFFFQTGLHFRSHLHQGVHSFFLFTKRKTNTFLR